MECLTPFTKKDANEVWQKFPCGKCLECMNRLSSGWSFRLVKEGETAVSSYFVTLTYNTDKVPVTKKGFMTLSTNQKIPNPKKPGKFITIGCDLTSFFKRLRKKSGLKNIKYYAVGEYGSKTMRPHYHLIIYNVNIQDILDSWKLGQVHFGSVSDASIGYTLKYMSKKGKIPMHANDDRVKEFAHMSKKLGAEYINDKSKKWHQADLVNRFYLPLKDGKKASMPRYYKERLYTKAQLGYLKGHMEKLHQEKEQKERAEHGENYDNYILQKVKNSQRKLKIKSNENGKI